MWGKKPAPFIFVVTLSKRILFPYFLASRYLNEFATKWQQNCPPLMTSVLTSLGRLRITWLITVQQDLKQHHLMLPEAADLAQNRPLWRKMST